MYVNVKLKYKIHVVMFIIIMRLSFYSTSEIPNFTFKELIIKT